jgi:hypothetical protein
MLAFADEEWARLRVMDGIGVARKRVLRFDIADSHGLAEMWEDVRPIRSSPATRQGPFWGFCDMEFRRSLCRFSVFRYYRLRRISGPIRPQLDEHGTPSYPKPGAPVTPQCSLYTDKDARLAFEDALRREFLTSVSGIGVTRTPFVRNKSGYNEQTWRFGSSPGRLNQQRAGVRTSLLADPSVLSEPKTCS